MSGADVGKVSSNGFERAWIEAADTSCNGCQRARDYISWLESELARRRKQIGEAFDAIDGRSRGDYGKHFTKYPCVCGAEVSNSGRAYHSHLRGSIHRQNLERKALGVEAV